MIELKYLCLKETLLFFAMFKANSQSNKKEATTSFIYVLN